jgi:hypothetical protein
MWQFLIHDEHCPGWISPYDVHRTVFGLHNVPNHSREIIIVYPFSGGLGAPYNTQAVVQRDTALELEQ